MTLIIEDGTAKADANSYITVAEYTAWANARFSDSRDTLPSSEAEYEGIILRGMDDFESKSFIGYKYTQAQALQWPRSGVYIDGFYVEPTTIPQQVKNALFELSYAAEIGFSSLSVLEQGEKRIKAGSVEIEYQDNTSGGFSIRGATAAMRKLLVNGGGFAMRAYRSL